MDDRRERDRKVFYELQGNVQVRGGDDYDALGLGEKSGCKVFLWVTPGS